MAETLPIAHFSIEQRHSQSFQTDRNFFLRDQRFNLSGEPIQLLFDHANLLHHRLKLGPHKLAALRSDLLPFAWPGPAGT